MRINILPNNNRVRYLLEDSNILLERRRNNTEAVESSRDRRMYFSVEKGRSNPLNGIKKALTKPPISQRRTRSTVKFVSRLRQSETIHPVKFK